MKSFTVVFTPESGHLVAFGPFETKYSAKEWMAQDFNDNYKMVQKLGINPQWSWDEHHLGSCFIESIGKWEISEIIK